MIIALLQFLPFLLPTTDQEERDTTEEEEEEDCGAKFPLRVKSRKIEKIVSRKKRMIATQIPPMSRSFFSTKDSESEEEDLTYDKKKGASAPFSSTSYFGGPTKRSV